MTFRNLLGCGNRNSKREVTSTSANAAEEAFIAAADHQATRSGPAWRVIIAEIKSQNRLTIEAVESWRAVLEQGHAAGQHLARWHFPIGRKHPRADLEIYFMRTAEMLGPGEGTTIQKVRVVPK